MDVRRVVQVWVRSGVRDGIGSGYLLSDYVVLTAAHVLDPLAARPEDCTLVGDEVLVQSHWGAGRTVRAARVLRVGGDIALLTLDRPFVHPLGPAPVRGTTGSVAFVLPAVIVGYPELELQLKPVEGTMPEEKKLTPKVEQYRRDRQLDGEISGGTGFGDGTLTVHLAPRHFPQPGIGRSGLSVFMGLSGAAIFIAGRLAGVVTEDPHPDHPTVVVGQRLDLVARQMQALPSMSGSIPDLAYEVLLGPTVDVSQTAGARAVRRAHLWHARNILERIPGGRLRDRGRELSQMARFSSERAIGYQVWHAYEWSGKSALLATFVAEPPAGTDVVAFFINRNDADARTADRYLASLINQLETYLDDPHEAVNVAVPGAAGGRYLDLLARAATAARDNGRRLVLVVDALDEDDAFTPNPISTTPILELLPAYIADLHVIVATRPYEHVLTALPSHHPFRTTPPLQLSASPHAADIRDEAAKEVRKAATGTDAVARSILAFLHVANDDLTPAELAELASHLPGNDQAVTITAVRTRLHTALHRSVWQRVHAGDVPGLGAAMKSDEAYGWAHETLPKMVLNEFGPAIIKSHAEALHAWADEHQRRGWTNDTPHYLESGYPGLLASAGHTARLTAYALDPMRHRWLHARRGGNDQTLSEIGQAAGLLLRSTPRDVGMLVLLAFERDRLHERYKNLPADIPIVWAMLGNTHRAEALARSMPTRRQPQVLAGIARALAEAGNAVEAQRIADTIADVDQQEHARARIAQALAEAGNLPKSEWITGKEERTARSNFIITEDQWEQAGIAKASTGDTREAERTATAISNKDQRARVLAGIAKALAEAGNTAEAERIASKAKRVAKAITNKYRRERVLATIARTLAVSGNAPEAERIADSITDENRRTQTLTGIAQALANSGKAVEAERIIDTIAHEYHRAQTLAGIAPSLAKSGNAVEAERIADSLADEVARAETLARIAQALAKEGNTAEAERIAGRAEEIANAITSEYRRERVLGRLSQALANEGNTTEAERIADSITDEDQRVKVLAGIAQALAKEGNTAESKRIANRAQRTANTITSGYQRSRALATIAQALAEEGNTAEAERIADSITDEDQRVKVLAGIAQALAKGGSVPEAERIAAKAKQIANTISYKERRDWVLVEIALALADHTAQAKWIAESKQVAESITDEDKRERVLARIALVSAESGNTGEAERIANTITDKDQQAQVLARIALVSAQSLANSGKAVEAERIIDTIAHEYHRAQTLAGIAPSLAKSGNAVEAERIADSLADEVARAETLARIAQALAKEGNTAEAERIAGRAEEIANATSNKYRRPQLLAGIAQALVEAGNIPEAERIANTITDKNQRTQMLAGIAQALAKLGNTPEAERIAATITDEDQRTQVLAGIAQALAEVGNTAEAERIACQVLATDNWQISFMLLLDHPLVESAFDPGSGWLTTDLVTKLLAERPV